MSEERGSYGDGWVRRTMRMNKRAIVYMLQYASRERDYYAVDVELLSDKLAKSEKTIDALTRRVQELEAQLTPDACISEDLPPEEMA